MSLYDTEYSDYTNLTLENINFSHIDITESPIDNS